MASPTTTRRRPRKRHFSNPGRTWAKGLERRRPGLVPFVLDELAGLYGRPVWQRQMVLGPAREFCLHAGEPVSMLAGLSPLVIPLRPTWPEPDGQRAL